jgi:hypothetical protein
MRAGRLKTTRNKTGGGRIGRVFLLILGIVLGAGAAALWQSGGIPLPAGGVSLPPYPTLTPEQSIREERTVALPGRAWYALQVGSFESEAEARTAAESFRSRGAAGYILKSGAYRVLAAAYTTRADAQTVQTQLREQHGVETLITEIIQPEVALRLTGQQAQLTALADAWDAIDQLAGHLSELSQRLDRREADSAQGLAALQSERETLDALKARLDTLFGKASLPAVREVSALLSDLSAALQSAQSVPGAIRLGAGIKHAHLLCVCRMAAYAAALAEK